MLQVLAVKRLDSGLFGKLIELTQRDNKKWGLEKNGDQKWGQVNSTNILNLYRFIDWIMKLPEEVDALFQRDMEKFEEEKKMQYVTNAERIGIKKGIPLEMV
jgi:hypothetical protein